MNCKKSLYLKLLFLFIQYPVCWQVECYKGKPQEKEGFAQFVKELSEEFKPRGWLLSAAVSPSKMVIDTGYAIPKLAKYLDFISVMTYGKYIYTCDYTWSKIYGFN